MTRIKDVPANTGIVVKGEAGTYEIPISEDKNVLVDNMLKGVTTPTVMHKIEGNYTNFILAEKNNNIGFYYIKDGSTLGANKAYLPLLTASLNFGAGTRLFMVFDDEEVDETTSIQDVNAIMDEPQTIIYNLHGQQLESLQRGINIVGGKKVLVK